MTDTVTAFAIAGGNRARPKTAARPSTTRTSRRGPAHPHAVLAVVLLGLFMAVLDTTVINVAAPTVRADLHASSSALEFAVSGYTLSYAVLLIVGARLGGWLGHARLFRTGLEALRWPS